MRLYLNIEKFEKKNIVYERVCLFYVQFMVEKLYGYFISTERFTVTDKNSASKMKIELR